MGYQVPAGISAKHVHLTEKDFLTLFGEGSSMTPFRMLSQPGQFAAEEKVDIIGPNGTLESVRIIGPARKESQVELSSTDCFMVGVPAVLRNSGDLEGTPGCRLRGPAGEIELSQGVIVSRRHLHLSPSEAAEAGVKDGDIVRVRIEGERGVVFENVLVRSGETHALDMHIDMDEANAAGIKNGDLGQIVD